MPARVTNSQRLGRRGFGQAQWPAPTDMSDDGAPRDAGLAGRVRLARKSPEFCDFSRFFCVTEGNFEAFTG